MIFPFVGPLGLWSISTAAPGLLLGWWVGQTVELALGGLVIGSLAGGATVRSLAWKIAGLLVVGAVSAIALLTIGYAQAPVLVQ